MRADLRLLPVLGAVLALAAGCSSGTGSVGADGTLAKLDGWRDGMTHDDVGFAVLELAYDDATARTLWDENVPDGLPQAEGNPLGAGVYGDLADVDFTEQVVGLYSSGQSGSCPAWVGDVTTDSDGVVTVTRAEDLQGGDGCTDDYNPFRVVIVIDRADVPSQDALGSARGTVDGNDVLGLDLAEYSPAP